MSFSEDDRLTLKKIKNGDISAFEMLFKENYQNLCYYAEDIVIEKAVAEEMVSDFFLKFWEEREYRDSNFVNSLYLYVCQE